MLRRALCSLGLLFVLWGGLASVLSPTADQPEAAARDACASSGERPADDADGAWTALRRAAASLSESRWKLPHVHAVAAATGGGGIAVAPIARPAADAHASHAPPHLRHVPLLI